MARQGIVIVGVLLLMMVSIMIGGAAWFWIKGMPKPEVGGQVKILDYALDCEDGIKKIRLFIVAHTDAGEVTGVGINKKILPPEMFEVRGNETSLKKDRIRELVVDLSEMGVGFGVNEVEIYTTGNIRSYQKLMLHKRKCEL